MTPDHLRVNLDRERELAHEALQEAQVLLDQGLPRGATTRAYFAVFHVARALVLFKGSEPRRHQGVAHYLHLYYVKTGLLPLHIGRRFAALQTFREDADYRPVKAINLEVAHQAVEDARAFLATCESLLDALTP